MGSQFGLPMNPGNRNIREREMLINTLKVLVNNPFKEIFYGKKKIINILTAFFISHKSCIKTFLKWIVNQYSKSTC